MRLVQRLESALQPYRELDQEARKCRANGLQKFAIRVLASGCGWELLILQRRYSVADVHG